MNRHIGSSLVVAALAAALAGCGGFGGGQLMAEEGMPREVPGRFGAHDAVVLHDVGWVHHHPYLLQRQLPIPFVFTRWTRIRLQQPAAVAPERFGILKVVHLDDLLEAQASVRKPDGRVVPLGPDDIRTVALVRDCYPGLTPPLHLHETRFIFPGIEAGDVLELRTTQVDWPPAWSFHRRDAPVLLSRIIVTRPNADIDLQLSLFDPGKVVGPVEEATLMGSARTGGSEEQRAWTARELEPLPAGDFRAPLVARESRLDMQLVARGVTLEEWAQAYRRWLFAPGQRPAELQAKARELVAGAADDREKARRLLAFVQRELSLGPDTGLTWVWPAAPPKPARPERWLAERQVSPERAVGVLAALLQAVGLTPTLVLTSDERAPMLSEGNRSLEQVTRLLLGLPDGALLDPAARFLDLGQVAPGLQGRPALWASADRTWFARLPELGPGENMLEVKIAGKLSPEGEFAGEAAFSLRGLEAREARAWLAAQDPVGRDAALAARLLAGWGPRAALEEVRLEAADDPARPLGVTLRYRLPGLVELAGDAAALRLGALWPASQVPAFAAQARAEPVWLEHAFGERAEVLLELPEGLAPGELPKGLRTEPAAAGEGMSVEARLEYGCQDGVLQMSRVLGLNQRAFGADFYPTLRAITERYLATAGERVGLREVARRPR